MVTLAVGAYVSINPDTGSGCIAIEANTSGAEAEYLLVPQVASPVPGRTLNFILNGESDAFAAPPNASLRSAQAPVGAASRFHEFLRRGEASRSWGGLAPLRQPDRIAPAVRVREPKPVVGDRRVFSVCGDLFCLGFDQVVARARAVGDRLAIFVDSLAPANGLTDTDLEELNTLFDTRLYPIDTLAFGSESDVNDDGVVIVLMTSTVNRLVTAQQCQDEGFISGFFLGPDIDPIYAEDDRLNHAEVFYSIVADPSGSLSCAHSTASVKRFMPITFIHELQHMISFNQHVLVGGSPDGEVLWLNEALSHYAEELGGRGLQADGNTQGYEDFLVGDLFNAYAFLENPAEAPLLPDAGIGSLAERGAGWLYLRYLVDQFAGGTTPEAWNAFTRSLVRTTRRGATNVEFVTGVPFVRSVSEWALANWADDLADVLPGFITPPELEYRSWNFRQTYAELNATRPNPFARVFPLVPTSGDGAATALSGTLHAGSGMYHRAFQAAGAPAIVLTFRAADGFVLASSHAPRLNIIRIR